jgi:hypothetical protein
MATLDCHPPLLAVAPQDGLAKLDLAVALLEGGEQRLGREIPRHNVLVERPEALLERVGEAFS